METTNGSLDVYGIITERIIKQLESGTVPWRQPWTSAGIPQNFLSRRAYRGVNLWLLSSMHYRQNFFLTWKQTKELGASVRKGEKAHIIIFTRWIDGKKKVKSETSEENFTTVKIPFLRYYKVFNIEQCDGIPLEKIPPLPSNDNNPITACEYIYKNMPLRPEIHEDSDEAFYNGHEDYINMPFMDTFESSESYYAVLFHEMIHSTGHPNRLNRKEWMQNTSYASTKTERYSLEELVAEMGACYLESVTGIVDTRFEQNASYIEGWLSKLRSDKRLIVIAGALAQKATDFILNIKQEGEDYIPVNTDSEVATV